MMGSLGAFEPYTLYEGDALALIEKIPDKSIDLILTDPPFAIDFKAQRLNYNRTGSNVIEGYREIPAEEYAEFTRRWIGQAARCFRLTEVCMFFPDGTGSAISSKASMQPGSRP